MRRHLDWLLFDHIDQFCYREDCMSTKKSVAKKKFVKRIAAKKTGILTEQDRQIEDLNFLIGLGTLLLIAIVIDTLCRWDIITNPA